MNESGQVVYDWNEEGPKFGPNGELELDPDNRQCGVGIRPVFATCKNNCPGGELSVIGRQIDCFSLVEKIKFPPLKVLKN